MPHTLRLRSPAGDESNVIWVDVPREEASPETLSDAGIPPEDHSALLERSLLPTISRRGDRVVVLMQLLDAEGRLFQVGSVVTDRTVVTVHGPPPASFSHDVARDAVDSLANRLSDEGADHPMGIVAGLFETLADGLEVLLGEAARAGGALDRRMRDMQTGDPETFLESAFKVRHDLVTIGSRLTQSREVCTMIALSDIPGAEAFESLRLRFERLRTVGEGEKEFLQGMLDYYESLTNTKMNIAMERLAVIAAVALPVTAIAGILGMNTIVSAETSIIWTFVSVAVMSAFAFAMLRWAKKHGWW